MSRTRRKALLLMTGTPLLIPFYPMALAEAPGEIPKPWTYEGSKKLQEQQSQGMQPPAQETPQGANRPSSGGAAPGAFATADAGGHAQTSPLPAGRYWVLSDGSVDSKHVIWHQPVDVKGSDASITLDQRNAMSVD